MKTLSKEQAQKIRGGSSDCGFNIAMSAALGGLFGGAGAIVGAVVAATGPSCLAVW